MRPPTRSVWSPKYVVVKIHQLQIPTLWSELWQNRGPAILLATNRTTRMPGQIWRDKLPWTTQTNDATAMLRVELMTFKKSNTITPMAMQMEQVGCAYSFWWGHFLSCFYASRSLFLAERHSTVNGSSSVTRKTVETTTYVNGKSGKCKRFEVKR